MADWQQSYHPDDLNYLSRKAKQIRDTASLLGVPALGLVGGVAREMAYGRNVDPHTRWGRFSAAAKEFITSNESDDSVPDFRSCLNLNKAAPMRSILFTLISRWRRNQKGVVNRLPQADGCRDISAKVCNDNLIIHNLTVGADPSAIGGQRDIYDAVRESHCDGTLIKNEGGVRGVANWDYSPFLGARIGVVCHDGSYSYWEWDKGRGRFVPFKLT